MIAFIILPLLRYGSTSTHASKRLQPGGTHPALRMSREDWNQIDGFSTPKMAEADRVVNSSQPGTPAADNGSEMPLTDSQSSPFRVDCRSHAIGVRIIGVRSRRAAAGFVGPGV